MSDSEPRMDSAVGMNPQQTKLMIVLMLKELAGQCERYMYLRREADKLRAQIRYTTECLKLTQAALRLEGKFVELPEGIRKSK